MPILVALDAIAANSMAELRPTSLEMCEHLNQIPCVKFITPCMPTLRSDPPLGGAWQHEVKFGGWQCRMVKRDRRVRIYSRDGHDLHAHLGSFVVSFQDLRTKSAVIDGELTVADPHNRPNFHAFGAAIRRRKRDLIFVAFDLLELDGRNYRSDPLSVRQEALRRVFERSQISRMSFSKSFGDGAALLKACNDLGLEGIVSKRRDAPYGPGRRTEWVEVKTAAWREANREPPSNRGRTAARGPVILARQEEWDTIEEGPPHLPSLTKTYPYP